LVIGPLVVLINKKHPFILLTKTFLLGKQDGKLSSVLNTKNRSFMDDIFGSISSQRVKKSLLVHSLKILFEPMPSIFSFNTQT
jgi:hypothetical protein